ncbi:MAG: type I DNA topoisomerase [bacterium]
MKKKVKKRKKSINKRVIIVESPTKCKTIKGFLGRDYTLVSSRGHIKDLPKSTLGVDIENNFQPRYIKIRGKAKIIQEIKKTCKDSSEIFLAPDPDREGEVIAKHLAEELESNGANIKRALFYEITPDHVKRALQHTTIINENLVNAHRARRVLDRIVGYYTSPLLWKIIKGGLSAGRVQSVALRLISEREKEITVFKPKPYWVVEAEFITERNEKFLGKLWRIAGEARKIEDKKELEHFKKVLTKGTKFKVTSFRVTEPTRTPPPPFITSTLQQEASKRIRFSAKKTMYIAQSLYEGIRLPQGSIGLITYMRTDSIRVNKDTLERLREYIAGKHGKEYLNQTVRIFKDRKNVQGGHEAIRPTKVELNPEDIKQHLTDDQYKIYKLIFNRFVASQMAPAEYRQKEIVVSFEEVDFKSEEMKLIFPGYQIVTGDSVDRGSVPDMTTGENVEVTGIEFTEKMTEPQARFTEASLIKKLEENGIGRPSTYAHILQTLFDRGYVIKEKSKIQATDLGLQVYDVIIPRFPDIFEVSFTAKMEKELDQIEAGDKLWQEVIREFYDPFIINLEKIKKEAEKIKEEITVKVDKNCPKCQKPLVVKWGRYGKFLACSGFPACKHSENFEVEKSDRKCPDCGRNLITRHGKFGKFLACSGYPECRYTENLSHDAPCPMCHGEVIIIKTRRGNVYKCKLCDFSAFYPPTKDRCPQCEHGMVLKRGKKVCPVCTKLIKKKKNGKK